MEIRSLRADVLSGIGCSAGSQWARHALHYVTIVILARWLDPSDFGLLAMAMVVVGFLGLFKDLGTSAAVIQREDCSEELLSSLFWANAAFGLLGACALFALAPMLAGLYREPRVEAILKGLSLTLLVSGFGGVHQALLARRLQFSTLGKVELTAALAGSCVGIAAAALGSGPWSLVLQALAAASAQTISLWLLNPWRPRWRCDWRELVSVADYSLNLTGFGIVNYLTRNADNLLIGRFLGPQSLGYYDLAYRLMLYPLSSVSSVVGRVLFPAFARMGDDDARLQRAYLRAVAGIALVTFPMMLGLLAASGPLIMAFFGAQWAPAILLVKILSPVGMVQSIATLNGAVYGAKGATGLQFRVGAAVAMATCASFVIGLRWGVTGVAAAYAVTVAVILYPSLRVPLGLIKLRVTDLLRVLRPILISSLAMLAVLLGLAHELRPVLPQGALLAALCFCGVLTYALSSWLISRDELREMLGMVRAG